MAKKRSASTPETVDSDSAQTVYERLFRINEAFDTVAVNLRVLRQHRWLQANQIRRFEELTAEARAAANSYLLEAFATQETAEAGRLIRTRTARGNDNMTKAEHGRCTQTERIATKFLRLREPVPWGHEIDGWHVCWLGGWDKCRVFYIVMVLKRLASIEL